jgi:N6-L-threonylcarbamoyladenine synthase
MKILAIETSCDETAVAVLEAEGGFEHPQFRVLGNTTLSQALKHAEFGGVYPNLAKREHSKNLIPVLKNTLTEAGMLRLADTPQNYSNILQNIRIVLEREPELLEQFLEFIPTIEKPDVDVIAVTQGPGLEPALWVGLNLAQALSLVWSIPLVPVNHMEGHVLSVLYRKENPNDKLQNPNINFPALALLISGGHTQLILVKDWLHYKMLGETRDDAVGEAFDKVARLLGLPYPGGPEISRLADQARHSNVLQNIRMSSASVSFPRPMIDSKDYDFSFSGLKTAVLYKVKELGDLSDELKQEVAREFEDAVVDVLIVKTKKALDEYTPRTLIVGGGVIANKRLREMFEKLTANYLDTKLLIPDRALATDNAIMIGIAGYFRYRKKEIVGADTLVRADGNLQLA